MDAGEINVLDLFAGCGGFSQGFKQAGFKIVAANEIWQPAIDTYSTNHKNTRMFGGDITSQKVKNEILNFFKDKPCDIIIGGPPCQAYSVAGLKLPSDPRGKLFKDYLYMVKKLKPKIFVMENVKGLLYINIEKKGLKPNILKSIEEIKDMKQERANLLLKRVRSKNTQTINFNDENSRRLQYLINKIPELEKKVAPYQGKLIEDIRRRIRKLGYESVEYATLNSADFGVPQLRERVVIIATRYDVPIEFPKATHSGRFAEWLLPWVTVRQTLDDLKDVNVDGKINHTFASHGKKFLRKIKKTMTGKTTLKTYKSSFKRLDPNKPSLTVKENHGAVFIHYEKDRVITARELARLQSFNDSFFFCSSKRDVLIQIGNAVPPLLAFAIAKSIRSMLTKIGQQSDSYKNIKPQAVVGMLNK